MSGGDKSKTGTFLVINQECPRMGDIAPTPLPSMASVLEGANRQAELLQDDYVGSEHVLLALAADPSAARVLARIGTTPEAVRSEVLKVLAKP
jgi:ATP-dependent Clp protease ATP-binding subunit ClpC